ncbi:MAG TPA: nuclease-related domain-containing protein [Woeseiaceae bacterium]|nr:nuclease-related domain-containing protein [Woeseiaceae bacterium]
MSETLPAGLAPGYLLPLILAALLLAWLLVVYRRRRQGARSLAKLFSSIAFDRIENLVVPNVDEGEIQIDHLLLTAQGLLIVDVKDVTGTVFGGDKMQDWTVISSERRFTFSNPQPALFDRIAAVREIVRQVPVAGRILFTDGAEFTKGVPSLVCKASDLLAEFQEADKAAARARVEAFRPQWELLRGHAAPARPGGLVRT